LKSFLFLAECSWALRVIKETTKWNETLGSSYSYICQWHPTKKQILFAFYCFLTNPIELGCDKNAVNSGQLVLWQRKQAARTKIWQGGSFVCKLGLWIVDSTRLSGPPGNNNTYWNLGLICSYYNPYNSTFIKLWMPVMNWTIMEFNLDNNIDNSSIVAGRNAME
jgi:hypothetical protein